MKVTVAVLSKQGENVVETVLDVLKLFEVAQPLRFGVVGPKRSLFDKNLALLSKQSDETSTLAGYATTQTRTASRYDFLQLDDAALFFEGKVFSSTPEKAISEQVSKAPLHCEATLQTLLEQSDGDYSFILLKEGIIAAGRDPIGVQPLYYGENRDLAAFASNRKALWLLGIENPVSFPPGNLGFANKDGFKFKAVKTLSFTEPKNIALEEAASQLQKLLQESIRRRIQGLKEVAVAFSGGLDSSVVAYLAHKLGMEVQLLHVSLENEEETEVAIEAAEALGLPLQVDLYKESDVEKALPKVVRLIEEADPVKAAIGVPFYWTAEKASEAGFKVILAGQGADELFGGYRRYVSEYCQNGAEKVLKLMFDDVARIHESNLERDLKITSFKDVELRLPFGSYDMAEFALSLPLDCKIEPKADTSRKLLLRKMALDIGVPAAIAKKPKKAVQYSTGINDAVKRIAKKQGKTVNEYVGELFQLSR
ncbi:MAG TPA: asparagine synthetase B [Candidatus Deferrimicrobiaceae bacterium]|nr:asparagine synthetase B [Candidatus Deferrimicrobiaceae bacterium]